MQFAFDDDFDLDRDFPLGDGTAEVGASAVCPHCGEAVSLSLDPGSGDRQEYVEDCEVCCRPWTVRVRYGKNGAAHVTLAALDG
jgi:hypothetical protein